MRNALMVIMVALVCVATVPSLSYAEDGRPVYMQGVGHVIVVGGFQVSFATPTPMSFIGDEPIRESIILTVRKDLNTGEAGDLTTYYFDVYGDPADSTKDAAWYYAKVVPGNISTAKLHCIAPDGRYEGAPGHCFLEINIAEVDQLKFASLLPANSKKLRPRSFPAGEK